MTLIDDVIATANGGVAHDICVGIKYTAVTVNGRTGLAHTFPGHRNTPTAVGRLVGRDLIPLVRSDNLVEAAIGAASLNACLPPMTGRRLNVFDHIVELADNAKRIGIVGDFKPLVRRLNAHGVWPLVFEAMPAGGQLPMSAEEDMLPDCDLVVLSGTAVVNHTLEDVLTWSGGYTLVIGPTTPLSPVLFEYGADAIAGVHVVDRGTLLASVSQGGGRRDWGAAVEDVFVEARA